MQITSSLQDTFLRILSNERYSQGVEYGQPRKGHSEGSVKNHIIELEKNLHTLCHLLTEDERWKLLILIHVHDTFKLWATRDAPIDDLNSHATLACAFLAEFTDDKDLLNIVQWHDENFVHWKQMRKKGHYNLERLKERVLTIQDLELYLFFTLIDGFTEGKMSLAAKEKPEKLRWFIDEVNKYRKTPRMYQALEIFGL